LFLSIFKRAAKIGNRFCAIYKDFEVDIAFKADNWFLSNDGSVKENVGACSESKQCRKREQREKNESERVYKEEDKIEERAVIGINKKIDGTVHSFQESLRETF